MHNNSGLRLQKGDLLYVSMDKPGSFLGRYPGWRRTFIRLLDVEDKPFYDRYLIFNHWTADDENSLPTH